MNQTLSVGADARGDSAAVGKPTSPAAADAPIAMDGFAFIGEVRTHLTTILGFAEMLADPKLALTDRKRAEYGEIVAASGALLAERIERRHEELRPL